VTRRGRDALIGALFVLLAVSAVLLTAVRRGQSESLHRFTVRSCIENLSDCRGQPLIRLQGAYVPGSQMWPTSGCRSEFDIQAPGAEPPGKIRVCSMQAATPAFDRQSQGPLADYLRRGLLLVETTGHFDGARMNASGVNLISERDRSFYEATFGVERAPSR